MSTHIIYVVAAVVDVRQLTLYQQDGTTVDIPQGDPRLAKIVEQITPILADGGIATIDLSNENDDNAYQDYEEASGGLVKFFKVAKSKLLSLFDNSDSKATPDTVPTRSMGTIPVHGIGDVLANLPFVEKSSVNEEQANRDRLLAATQEIISHATPVAHPEFHERDVDRGETVGTHTIISVVDNQIVPGVEQLRPQIARAVELGSTKGMDAFMTRISKVAKDRQHSVDDLLKFLKRGDLPIADNGSIIIYKVLKRASSSGYVDCHTRLVSQRVGSRVWMDPSLVDHDRTQECSNGLHVARRAYIGRFSGDVCVLAYVHPEDVIAVPEYDSNKMRVCSYDILAELPYEAYECLKQNKPFSDNSEAKLLLGRAIAGDFPEPNQSVHITERKVEGVIITPLVRTKEENELTKATVKVMEVVKEAEPINTMDKTEIVAPAVDPKDIAQKVMAVKAETRVDKAQRLWNAFSSFTADAAAKHTAANELLLFKKKAKVSWISLGLPYNTGDILQASITKPESLQYKLG